MPWSSWNVANKTLLFAFAVFLFSLELHLAYPHSVFADGLLFCSEAALVGGVADWFAVTALFKKPLGFPYHTALLPRNRERFTKASIALVQKEFFSKQKIFLHLKELHLLPFFVEYLKKTTTKEKGMQTLLRFGKNFFLQKDLTVQAEALTRRVRVILKDIPVQDCFRVMGQELQKNGRDRELFSDLAVRLRAQVEREETRDFMEAFIGKLAQKKATGAFALFMAGIAEMLDVLNVRELAERIQKQFSDFLLTVSEQESEAQTLFLQTLYCEAEKLGQKEEFLRLAQDMKDTLMEEIPLQEAILRMLTALDTQLKSAEFSDEAEDGRVVLPKLLEIFQLEYDRAVHLMDTDIESAKKVELFLHDIVARSALKAQLLVGVVVESVLSRMSDEQLNRLVYDKVEPDLLWIRVNGSLLGSGIGILLFTGGQIAKQWM